MHHHMRPGRRWQVVIAVSSMLLSSLVVLTATATPAAAEETVECPTGARRYVASGDGVVNGTHASSGERYSDRLLNDRLRKIPAGTGSAPWCLDNTATDPATTDSFVNGSGNQLSPAWNLKPSLVTLQLGRQNTTIVDQITTCYKQIEVYQMFPLAEKCAKDILNDPAAWSKLQRDLGSILNTYKTQMSGNPSLVVAVLGYYNPYPEAKKVYAKLLRLCKPLIDTAINCALWWGLGLPPALAALDQVVRKLNDTISPVVRQFTIASQGRFFFVNPYEKFRRHCMQMRVLLATPLVYHPPAALDSHFGRLVNMGCRRSWIAWDESPGVFAPYQYLNVALTPPGIVIVALQTTWGMGVNPNAKGHECLSDLIWETVKNKLGVPEKADPATACSRSEGPPEEEPPAEVPPPLDSPDQPDVAPASAQVQGHVTAGGVHSCAVLAAGGATGPVHCWGNNDEGQLGNGTMVPSTKPVPVTGITNARAVDAGSAHTCVLRADGSVWCWGDDTSGQLGDGPVTTGPRTAPVQATGVTGATAVASGDAFSCAIVTGGTVKCWGDDGVSRKSSPLAVSGITTANPATAIAAGGYHACALLADQTVRCWGDNSSGQLGDGTLTDRSTPVPVRNLPDRAERPRQVPVAITAGSSHTCVLLQDNSARCWGGNSAGQLGYQTPEPAADDPDGTSYGAAPNAVRYDADPTDDGEDLQPLYGMTAISAGMSHTCAVMSDGSARCWGDNGAGQLGTELDHGTHDHTHDATGSAVVVSGLSGARGLNAGSAHSCAIVATEVRCWGLHREGQLGHRAPFSLVPVPVKNLTRPTVETDPTPAVVTAGTNFACALVDGPNRPLCWGDGASGQLGANPPPADGSVPTAVSGLEGGVEAIDAGNGHVCALPKATTSLLCWGRNSTGQLGDGTTANQVTPVAVAGPVVAPKGISAGGGATDGHTCAVQSDSTVACWGRNGDFQLGDGTSTDRTSPVTVQIDIDPDANNVVLGDLTGATRVATGGHHSCAVQAPDGKVWCWGRNDNGQLGDDTVIDRRFATPVHTHPDPALDAPLTGVTELAAGLSSTCAVAGAGGVACWGANARGQLGDGSIIERHLPVAVGGLGARATSITAGDLHVCVRLEDDSVSCWGGNSSGQVGNGSKVDATLPQPILTSPAAAVVAGKLGPEDEPRVLSPFIRSISASRSNTCVNQAEVISCWGDNSHGQLTDGVGNVSATPLRVDLVSAV